LAERTVSAVILTYDGERYLAEAIESALAQTVPCAEVVVVDNGSTDGSVEIARSYGPETTVRMLGVNRGIGFARNEGLAVAKGDCIAFLDHDDTWEPRKNELQLAALSASESPDMVFGHVRQFFSPDLDPAVALRLKQPEAAQPGLYLGAMLAPRQTWERVGPWERAWEAADGLAWLVRARGLGLREAMLPDLVANRRIHGSNQSFQNHDARAEWAHVLKASLDRRREEGGDA
jgi:glycosyltransferase involved in cell wall biosynthesis